MSGGPWRLERFDRRPRARGPPLKRAGLNIMLNSEPQNLTREESLLCAWAAYWQRYFSWPLFVYRLLRALEQASLVTKSYPANSLLAREQLHLAAGARRLYQ